jgi:hypothetical protein
MADQTIVVRDGAFAYASAQILAAWSDIDPYDGDAVQAFTVAALPLMVSAQTTVARAAGAAQHALLTAMGVRVRAAPTDPVNVRRYGIGEDGKLELRPARTTVAYRGGEERTVDLEAEATTQAVFNRPARTYRYLKSTGAADEAAKKAARNRINALVDDNLLLAQRLAETEIIAKTARTDDRLVGHRRVIRPEISRSGTCGLCIKAADKVYGVTQMRPVHKNCKCGGSPVTRDHDPADEMNQADLKQLYKDAGSTAAEALKQTTYSIGDHGELGAVFVPEKLFRPGGTA